MEGRQSTLRLKCSFQSYDWGRSGKESTVAKLYSRNSSDDIDPEMPYAEFWMGTHDSGTSFVVVSKEDSELLTLKSWIRDNPAVLGHKVTQTWGVDLPFLFKVLSVDKALSIQAHPDKDLARLLHEANPNVYKDSNHKPEMALALTEFKALCGFLTAKELKDVFAAVPEITEIVGADVAAKILNSDEEKDDKTLLRSTFTQLMLTGKEKISEVVSKLTKRLNSESEVRVLTVKEELALLLENQYPSDVGVIAAFFFNYVELSPGEALYLGANEPHAYISGECIECMATSDNVVRAGLTPKFRDVETLCSMLTYKQGFPEILQGTAMNPYITRYSPPSDEFEVDLCLLPGDESVAFPAMPGPSIFLVMSGEGSMLAVSLNSENDFPIMEGSVLFVPAQTELKLTSATSGSLHIYRAGTQAPGDGTFRCPDHWRGRGSHNYALSSQCWRVRPHYRDWGISQTGGWRETEFFPSDISTPFFIRGGGTSVPLGRQTLVGKGTSDGLGVRVVNVVRGTSYSGCPLPPDTGMDRPDTLRPMWGAQRDGRSSVFILPRL